MIPAGNNWSITVAPSRKPGDPWQSTDGRWWTPGHVTPEGHIVSATPGQFISSGVVWINREQASEAERHGWRRGNHQGLPDKRDLIQVGR